MQDVDAAARQGLVVFAKDKARVSAFYRRALGLHAEEEEPTHDVLVGKGMELVIHSIPARYAEDIEISTPPRRREDTALKPTFVVGDLDALRVAVEETGGWLKARDDAWLIRGATVLDGCDPEGNVVQFKQFEK